MTTQIFDTQFWTLLIIGAIMLFIGGWVLKSVIVTAVSKTITKIMCEQWDQIFLIFNENTEDIRKLRNDHDKLRKEFDDHVNNLKQ